MSRENLQVGAYFYPLTTREVNSCIDEANRTYNAGERLGRDFIKESLTEFELVEDACPLFEGHQVTRYCLPSEALHDAMNFTTTHVPEEERLVTIFAWNEISEGAALMPRLFNRWNVG
jgi:hypothetical protein